MLVSVFIALFLPCAGMSAIFVVYVCLLCYSARGSDEDRQSRSPVKSSQSKGLSASDLEKLPTVTGGDLVMGGDCPICLDGIEIEQTARVLPGCNHGFHRECADAWLSKNSICPVCRGNLGAELFEPSEIASPC